MERQKRIVYQMDLFLETNKNVIRQSGKCEDVNQAIPCQEKQVNKEGRQRRALAENLMIVICSSRNLEQAHKRVKRNRGVAGIDQMVTGK